jgi:TP901 family phage tail tape measure protein
MAGNIKGITIEINGDTTKLDKALRDVNKETRIVQRQLSDVERALKMDPGNADLIQQKQRLLGEEIQSTESKLSMLKQADEKTAQEMANGTEGAAEKHAELQRQIAITEAKGKALNAEMRKLGNVKLTALSESFKTAGAKITTAGKAIMPVSLAAAAVGGASIKMATDFDESFKKLTTIADTGSGKGQVSIDKLKSSITSLSNETGVSSAQIAEAAYQAISAGQSTGNALKFVENSAKLSKAGFTDMTTATDTLTTVLNAYGMKANQVGKVSDYLITTQNLGKTTVQELGQTMGQVIPTAASYGVSMKQLSAAYIVTTKNGVNTANATTYINSMLNELGKSGSKASKILKSETGKSFSECMKSGMSLEDVLGVLNDHAKKSKLSINDMFGNTRAAKGAAILVQHTKDWDGAMQGLGKSSGATEKAFAKMEESAGTNFEKLKTSAQNALIGIGGPMLETLTPIMQGLAEAAKKFTAWYSGLSDGGKKVIGVLLMITAAVGPVLILIGKMATGIGSILGLVSRISASGVSLGSVIGALTSPIGLVIAAIAAAIVVGVLLYKNWDKIKATAQKVFTAVQKIITSVMKTIKSVITTIWSGIKKFFVTVLTAIAAVFRAYFDIYLTIAKTVFTAIKIVITTVMNAIRVVIRTVWNAIKGIFSSVTGAIKSIVTRAWNGIKSVTSSVFHSVLSVTKSIWSSIKSAISSVVSAVKGVVSRGWHAIRSVTSSVFNAVKNAMVHPIQTALSVIRGIVDRIKGLFHFSISMPHIPLPHFSISPSGWKMSDLLKGKIPKLGVSWYATGGIFDSPQVIGVGDAKSPEAVTPIDKLKGYVKEAVQESGGAGYVVNNYITVNGAEDPDDWAMRFARTLKREMRMT